MWAFGIWLVLLGLRSLLWRWRRKAACGLCGHVGRTRNEVRGSWKRELIRFAIFVPPGFFFHLLMGIYLTYFITRWFVVRHCEACGSECLDYP